MNCKAHSSGENGHCMQWITRTNGAHVQDGGITRGSVRTQHVLSYCTSVSHRQLTTTMCIHRHDSVRTRTNAHTHTCTHAQYAAPTRNTTQMINSVTRWWRPTLACRLLTWAGDIDKVAADWLVSQLVSWVLSSYSAIRKAIKQKNFLLSWDF